MVLFASLSYGGCRKTETRVTMTDFPICRSEDIFAQTLVAPVLFLECF